jgi:predicted nucleic acid-binding protein
MSSAPTASDGVVYADASALVKLLTEELETAALEQHLLSQQPSLISSAIFRVEVVRAARLAGADEDAETKTQKLMGEIRVLAVTDAILSRAMRVHPPLLRTLDAIHLASALEVGAEEMIAYDGRLAEAARLNGLTVTSPGA